jgi:ParB family chromosome partitioning protein
MSERVGKKRSTIANYLLFKTDPIIQTGIRDGSLVWVMVEQLSILKI